MRRIAVEFVTYPRDYLQSLVEMMHLMGGDIRPP
jgi:hypothetical protein